jgi:hypothetical protein
MPIENRGYTAEEIAQMLEVCDENSQWKGP